MSTPTIKLTVDKKDKYYIIIGAVNKYPLTVENMNLIEMIKLTKHNAHRFVPIMAAFMGVVSYGCNPYDWTGVEYCEDKAARWVRYYLVDAINPLDALNIVCERFNSEMKQNG